MTLVNTYPKTMVSEMGRKVRFTAHGTGTQLNDTVTRSAGYTSKTWTMRFFKSSESSSSQHNGKLQ